MFFEHQSKSKRILFIFFVLVLLTGVSYFAWIIFVRQPELVACTKEAKLCPDGSYVGRTGPGCEFAECPSGSNQALSDFGNDQLEQAVTDYLLTQELFSWKTNADSRNFCVIENLNPEDNLFPLYVWVRCGEYIAQDGKLKELSGSSVPARINYPNELSFYDLSRFSYEVPGDGSHYLEDIEKIFPANVQQRIVGFDREDIVKRIEAIAIDWFSSDQEE